MFSACVQALKERLNHILCSLTSPVFWKFHPDIFFHMSTWEDEWYKTAQSCNANKNMVSFFLQQQQHYNLQFQNQELHQWHERDRKFGQV